MTSIIKEIFYGNNARWDSLKADERYVKLLHRSAKLYERIKCELSPERQDDLRILSDLHAEMEAMTAADCFAEGMKLGIRLGVEAFE